MKALRYILLKAMLVFLFCNGNHHLLGQNKTIDSLLNVLKTQKEDTTKVNTLVTICEAYMDLENYDKSNQYANEAIDLSEKIDFTMGKANALCDLGSNSFNTGKYEDAIKYNKNALALYQSLGIKLYVASLTNALGFIYYTQSKFPIALKYYLESVKLHEKINNKKGLANSYNFIGIIYQYEGAYPEALSYAYKSLKIRQEYNDKHNMAYCYTNIGIVYSKTKSYEDALKNYDLALQTYSEDKDKKNIAGTYINIGNVYKEKNNYSDALANFVKGKEIFEELKDKKSIVIALNNIGSVMILQGNASDANKTFEDALKLATEINDDNGMCSANQNLGKLYIDLGLKTSSNKERQMCYTKAEEYLNKSLNYAKTLNSLEDKMIAYKYFVQLDSAKGNYKQSLEHYKTYINYRDSIENKENTKKIVENKMEYDFSTKEEKAKAEQDKKDALANKEKEKQQVIIYSVSAGLLLVLVLSLFILRGYRQKQKANLIITKQKELVEKQKAIVESQNHDITDSIKYAKNIQEALLPPLHYLLNEMNDSFVLYLPKDIVSGDFYWFAKQGNKRFIASVDCTGHGVPGAFMSIVGNTLLNEIVSVEKITEPSEVLNHLHTGVKTALKQTSDGLERRDGMDIALCTLNEDNTVLEYAGANRPLWIFRKDKPAEDAFEMIKANKFPIGGLEMESETKRSFTNHIVNVQKGDMLYIFSDGYADQFGGEKGKKYMLGNLQKLISTIYDKPIKEQEQILHTTFLDWKGELEQVDDVLVIGFRI